MEPAAIPETDPKVTPGETIQKEPVVVKSEPPEDIPDETGKSKIPFEVDDQKAHLSTLSDVKDTLTEITATVSSQAEEGIDPGSKQSFVPEADSGEAAPAENSAKETPISDLAKDTPVADIAKDAPVTDLAADAKKVLVESTEAVHDKDIDSARKEAIEEGVSRAVTELRLDQPNKIDHNKDDEHKIERLQPENELTEKSEEKKELEEKEKEDSVSKNPLLTEEEKMDVDPCQVDDTPAIEDGRAERDQDVPMKEETNERKQEDEIDEAWKSEDFDIPPSDGEDENYFSEPPSQVIVDLYQKLEEGNVLNLEWTCLGRRTPDEDGEKMEVEAVVEDNQEDKVDQPVFEDPTEFDFDIDAVMKVTPRRTPGFEVKGSGSAKKRVAKMDKVLDDIRRFSKINQEMAKTGDDLPPPLQSDLEVTPQRPLGKFHIRRDLHQ